MPSLLPEDYPIGRLYRTQGPGVQGHRRSTNTMPHHNLQVYSGSADITSYVLQTRNLCWLVKSVDGKVTIFNMQTVHC